nr:2Fe-2S iron-sulfur cluster-binding protein [Bradyrhizobium diazoefficiens]
MRLDNADERAIRVGLSGNLCRCTGYVGIVRAVRSVIDDRRKRGIRPLRAAGREQLGPVGSANSASDEHSVPGVSLTDNPTPEHVEGVIRVKLGPISAGFRGAARIQRDPVTMSGRIVGMGTDHYTRSSTRGEVRYRLLPIDAGTATRVEISVGYSMQGILAQIAREGLVRGLAARLTAEFARNLERELSVAARRGPVHQAKPIDGVALVFDRLRLFVREIFRRT